MIDYMDSSRLFDVGWEDWEGPCTCPAKPMPRSAAHPRSCLCIWEINSPPGLALDQHLTDLYNLTVIPWSALPVDFAHGSPFPSPVTTATVEPWVALCRWQCSHLYRDSSDAKGANLTRGIVQFARHVLEEFTGMKWSGQGTNMIRWILDCSHLTFPVAKEMELGSSFDAFHWRLGRSASSTGIVASDSIWLQ
jgi:hypothetical protein